VIKPLLRIIFAVHFGGRWALHLSAISLETSQSSKIISPKLPSESSLFPFFPLLTKSSTRNISPRKKQLNSSIFFQDLNAFYLDLNFNKVSLVKSESTSLPLISALSSMSLGR